MVSRVLEVLDENRAGRGFAFDDSDPHVVCPWHGFEFSIKTGRHAGVDDVGLAPVPVDEQNGRVYVTI
jgi:nitrite reductase/ring-hydroxylating ferredoxin subunit